MNKIEKAIRDCKLKIDLLKKEKLIIMSQIDVLEDQLSNLEAIERNTGIPHIEGLDKAAKTQQENV